MTVLETATRTTSFMKQLERGQYVFEPHEPETKQLENGVAMWKITLGPRSAASADIQARVAQYPTPENLHEALHEAASIEARVTVVTAGESMYGTPVLSVRQGRVLHSGADLAILPTGKRSKGFYIKNPLDVLVGTSEKEVSTVITRLFEGTGIPPTQRCTAEALATATGKHPLCVLFTHPGFGGGPVPGCVWYINQVAHGIANGYLWCPPSELESEHGSIEVSRLVADGALIAQDINVTFSEVFELPSEPADAYRVLLA